MKRNIKQQMVKVCYEYLGSRFIESPKGAQTHIDDNGDILHGIWENVWYEGSDEMPESDVKEYIAKWKKCETRRNFVVKLEQ